MQEILGKNITKDDFFITIFKEVKSHIIFRQLVSPLNHQSRK